MLFVTADKRSVATGKVGWATFWSRFRTGIKRRRNRWNTLRAHPRCVRRLILRSPPQLPHPTQPFPIRVATCVASNRRQVNDTGRGRNRSACPTNSRTTSATRAAAARGTTSRTTGPPPPASPPPPPHKQPGHNRQRAITRGGGGLALRSFGRQAARPSARPPHPRAATRMRDRTRKPNTATTSARAPGAARLPARRSSTRSFRVLHLRVLGSADPREVVSYL